MKFQLFIVLKILNNQNLENRILFENSLRAAFLFSSLRLLAGGFKGEKRFECRPRAKNDMHTSRKITTNYEIVKFQLFVVFKIQNDRNLKNQTLCENSLRVAFFSAVYDSWRGIKRRKTI